MLANTFHEEHHGDGVPSDDISRAGLTTVDSPCAASRECGPDGRRIEGT